MYYKGFLIADLHIGAIDSEIQCKEIREVIIKRLKEENPDYIVFLGDFFDHKASLNDELSNSSFSIFIEILTICESMNKDVKIRFVYGTESHEWNQYRIIEQVKSTVDVRVIHFCEEEELFPGLHVLYIPEEYIYNKNEYYEKFLLNPKKYDYIFGHGVIREVMKEAALNMDNASNGKKRAPVFSSGELLYACKGKVYFGHYHIHSSIGDDVTYVGSFNRWCFGEEEEKGFYITTIDGDRYTDVFVENNLTPIYKTISFGYDNKIFKDHDTLMKKLDQIDKMIKDKVFDYVRFQFNIPQFAFDPEYIMKVLKERYRYNESVKLNIVHGYIEEKKKQEKKEVEKWCEENAPLFNRDTEVEDKVVFFVDMEFKRKIPIDHVRRYLYKPLSEILIEYGDEKL